MKNTRTKYQTSQSTYALLVHSQEEENSAYETAIYMLLTLIAIFSIWQVAQQPLRSQVTAISQSVSTAQVAPSTGAAHQHGA